MAHPRPTLAVPLKNLVRLPGSRPPSAGWARAREAYETRGGGWKRLERRTGGWVRGKGGRYCGQEKWGKSGRDMKAIGGKGQRVAGAARILPADP